MVVDILLKFYNYKVLKQLLFNAKDRNGVIFMSQSLENLECKAVVHNRTKYWYFAFSLASSFIETINSEENGPPWLTL